MNQRTPPRSRSLVLPAPDALMVRKLSGNRLLPYPALPDHDALVWWQVHRVPGLDVKCLVELIHVATRDCRPQACWGMRIGPHQQLECFVPDLLTPDGRRGDEEALLWCQRRKGGSLGRRVR